MGKSSIYNEITLMLSKDNNCMEKAIIVFLKDTFVPKLELYLNKLTVQCIASIEKTFNQYIDKSKAKTYIENMAWHVEKIQQRLNNEKNSAIHESYVSETSKTNALEIIELNLEWMSNLGNIKKEDEELSAIWEGWFIEMNNSPTITDQRRALNIMKTLSAEDAKLLLDIKERGKIKFSLFSIKSLRSFFDEPRYYSEKSLYFVNGLLKNELITKTNGVNISKMSLMIMLCSISILVYFLYTFLSLSMDVNSVLGKSLYPFSTLIIVVTLFLIWRLLAIFFQRRYSLTWIGEMIVSYANKKP